MYGNCSCYQGTQPLSYPGDEPYIKSNFFFFLVLIKQSCYFINCGIIQKGIIKSLCEMFLVVAKEFKWISEGPYLSKGFF